MTEEVQDAPLSFDVTKVMAALPHRYPLLLVDRVVSLTVGERIHAIKAVTMNEQFFQGHFPGRPIMPGVLQIEALAQAAGVLAVETLGLAGTGKLVYFMAIEEAKFRTLWNRAACSTSMSSSRRSVRACASSRARPCSATRSPPSAASPR
jgi:3-hydroxyacyl-[acyl-carrier-protein] dehydratase